MSKIAAAASEALCASPESVHEGKRARTSRRGEAGKQKRVRRICRTRCISVAEKQGFEPWIPLWGILT